MKKHLLVVSIILLWFSSVLTPMTTGINVKTSILSYESHILENNEYDSQDKQIIENRVLQAQNVVGHIN